MGERELLSSSAQARAGLKFRRFFTQPGESPYEAVRWEQRTASITNEKGEVIFEQHGVEVPADWSQTATNIVASKYFHGKRGTPEREASVRELIGRVADTLAQWGQADGYFAGAEDRETFCAELTHMLLHQQVAFNSPVWFNVGVQAKPQCSACFI
ncbi:MAG: vitamin B12-dependent ribonucleotide reductase, partial [Terriglobia bacterium]